MPIARTIVTPTHGRFLVEPALRGRAGILIGFHGYGEDAEAQLERLRAIPGSDAWFIVSVQGLHRFYNRRSQDIVASWMTSQDRELAIADNLHYVNGVVEAVAGEAASDGPLVFAGFSQGVAMAFRAASASPRAVAGVIAAGGDVPPEIDERALSRIKSVLICRGERDEWYTDDKWRADVARLKGAGVKLNSLLFGGGHEWNEKVATAAETFLLGLTDRR
jgi:predicted esterase